MNSSKDHAPVPHVEVDDPAAAFRRFQDATRKVLAVPKHATPPTPPVPTAKMATDRPN